ncbi:DUF2812 domain-containing protein [Corynebacterium pseudotuberculosis]|uniref:DUF2812 domain-containing protein n=1 Tax=Corynebacterium pseudotuberculosis 258 TaxID=1168865 RepID=A0AAU8Q8P8_CORPS|nr:DUF2812 domain-containing protein [Corynebacterium pseudotuberculosis]AER68166.1 Hypothetical protein Cp106_0038 [Corynebacterium pseudotuberculosis 1/06-A]AEQ05612.1 DUF2812 domain-containing protein [Corynebacterium pseudotuberculosis CIP 52.97]AFB71382.1 DUF2812 domain-containing protein [Corynebacterium pseudotuberculosis 316]AFK15701.1 DUF2812 domain-containing protein [Corynebacterium pseudotuberculosis 258]AKS12392.1 Hypothetical protein CpE19_0048 [Corynebacterium pseudotuberculosis
MNTIRIGSGLAFPPNKDLELFSRMAAKGKHLSGVGLAGHGWTFKDGEPEHAIFDLVYEHNPHQDFYDIFAAAGWTHVLSASNIHVFKAPPGTTPAHTSIESKREEFTRQIKIFSRYSATALAVFIAAVFIITYVQLPSWVAPLVLVITFAPVVYTVMPLLGYCWHRFRLPAPQSLA